MELIMTKTFTMSEIDAAQVGAILSTHSEMQDARIHETMTIIGRLQRDDPESPQIEFLTSLVAIYENDSDNLKRLAQLFK